MISNNCKNCIHFEVCEEYQKILNICEYGKVLNNYIEDYDLSVIAKDCRQFKHKERFIDNGSHKIVKHSFL